MHDYLLTCYYIWLDEKLRESRDYVCHIYSGNLVPRQKL